MAGFNFNSKFASRPEVVDFHFRLSSAGAIVAPAVGAMATAARSSAGVFTLTFPGIASFAEFLGAQVTVEGTGNATQITPKTSWDSTNRILTITLLDAKAASAATDSACAVTVVFSDSVVP